MRTCWILTVVLLTGCSTTRPRTLLGQCIHAIDKVALPHGQENLPRIRLNNAAFIGTVLHGKEPMYICVARYGIMDHEEKNRLRRRPTFLVFLDNRFSIVECCRVDTNRTEELYIEGNRLLCVPEFKHESRTVLDFDRLPKHGKFVVDGDLCELKQIHRHNKSGLGRPITPATSP
jgi:hypothetical protein